MDETPEHTHAIDLLRRWLNAYTMRERERLDEETRAFLTAKRVAAERRAPLDAWLGVVHRSRTLALVLCALFLAGCGNVDQVAAGGAGGAAGAFGPDASGSAGSGPAGAAGGPPSGGAAGGGGQGGAIPLGADAGGAAGTEIDGGASWPTCPKVGGLNFQLSDHCWMCAGENDAGSVGGMVSGPCEISAADARGLSLQATTYCATRVGLCP